MTDTESLGANRPEWVDNTLFPFESHFIDIGGNTVHYIDEGSGPTLLFLHGNPTWSFLWRDVIAELRNNFRCIALDYPGFGLSTATDRYRFLPAEHAEVVTAFVDALSLEHATLVGQDWGGMIGLATAERRPEVFDRLILANTWAWPVNGDFHFEWFGRIIGSAPFRFLVRRFNVLVNWFLPAGHGRRRPTDSEMAHYRSALDTPQRRQASAVLPGQVLASREFFADVETGLGDIAHLPTLIIWGDRDIAFRPKELQRLEKAFPDHTTVIIDGAGGYTASDAPEEFIAAVRDWAPTRESSPGQQG